MLNKRSRDQDAGSHVEDVRGSIAVFLRAAIRPSHTTCQCCQFSVTQLALYSVTTSNKVTKKRNWPRSSTPTRPIFFAFQPLSSVRATNLSRYVCFFNPVLE